MFSTKDSPVIVEYKDGNLPKKLPYGTPFVIQGDPIHPISKDTIEKIELYITKNNDTVFFTSWKRIKKDNKLKIAVDQELYPGQKYKVTIKFFMEREIDSSAVKEIIDSVKNYAIQLYDSLNGSGEQNMKSFIDESIKSVSKKYPNYYYIDDNDTINGINLIYSDKEWPRRIMNLAATIKRLKKAKKKRDDYYKEIKHELNSICKDSSDACTSKCIDEIKNTDSLSNLKIDALLTCFNRDTVLFKTIITSLYFVKKEITTINSLKNETDSITLQLKALEEKLKKSKSLYVEAIPLEQTVPDEKNVSTGNDPLDQIGLRYGIAYTPVSNSYHQMFQYVAARFYFLPIDKTMNSPYQTKHSLNRLALNIGAVVGEIDYKGQQLHSIENLGVKLLTGISWDLTAQVSSVFGALWFEYNEGNPFNQIRETKASAFGGLTFDFNLIETLRR